jgi:hypothetical protein
MQRGRCASESAGLARWLVPASVFHAALALLGMVSSRWAGAPSLPATPEQRLALPDSMELTLLDDHESLAAALERSASPESAPEARLGREVSLPAEAAITSLRRAEARAARQASLLTATPSTASAETPPLAPDDASSARAGEEVPVHEAPAALSLDQLGIGTDPFIDVAPPVLSAAEQANQRLQASLRQPWSSSDRQRALGNEGPLVNAARSLLLAEDGLIDTSALLNIRVDGAGRVTDVHVLDAASDVRAWQMLAARLAKALSPVTLRGRGTNRTRDVKLQLASAMQLPSGAAPGLRTDILWQTLPGSAGPGATSLSLSPTSPIPMAEPIDSIGRHLDEVMIVELGLLKLKGDIADVAGGARRMVRVAVLSVEEATP